MYRILIIEDDAAARGAVHRGLESLGHDVVAVDASDQMSAYHTSLDDTADPKTGWYVSWDVP